MSRGHLKPRRPRGMNGTLIGRMVDTLDTIHTAWGGETRVWVRHLTGEGPATLRRQRRDAAAAMSAEPLESAEPGGQGGPARKSIRDMRVRPPGYVHMTVPLGTFSDDAAVTASA